MQRIVFASGKGGTGKTTLTALTARLLADTGERLAHGPRKDVDVRVPASQENQPSGRHVVSNRIRLWLPGCFRRPTSAPRRPRRPRRGSPSPRSAR